MPPIEFDHLNKEGVTETVVVERCKSRIIETDDGISIKVRGQKHGGVITGEDMEKPLNLPRGGKATLHGITFRGT